MAIKRTITRRYGVRPVQMDVSSGALSLAKAAETVAKSALTGGADRLGVATLEEGIQLRNAGLKCQILILGNLINAEELYSSFCWDLIPTISGIREAIICNNIAEDNCKKFIIHLKVDTGMTRLGCHCNEVKELISEKGKL